MLPGIPIIGRDIPPERALEGGDIALKKKMADVALNAARTKGATYTDVRIGRYLNQYVITREDKVENIVNTESYGMGIRVIANGSWGFAATDKLDNDGIAKAADLAVAIAKENSRLLSEPVRLAPQKGYGEVTWKAPIEKNAFEVPSKRKSIFAERQRCSDEGWSKLYKLLPILVNEQNICVHDGSYIDQDVHGSGRHSLSPRSIRRLENLRRGMR